MDNLCGRHLFFLNLVAIIFFFLLFRRETEWSSRGRIQDLSPAVLPLSYQKSQSFKI